MMISNVKQICFSQYLCFITELQITFTHEVLIALLNQVIETYYDTIMLQNSSFTHY